MEEMEKTQQHEYRWQGEERRKQQGDYSGEERRKAAATPDQETEQEPDQSAHPQDDDPEATQH